MANIPKNYWSEFSTKLMYVEETFMSDDTNLKIIKSFIQERFLKIEKRKTYFYTNQIFYHSQILNYNDCLYRYLGEYEFVFRQ